jgi:vancomycin resistance protein YoaR
LDIYQLRQTMTPNSKMDLPVLVSYPQTTLADTNDLGIKELVAVGESDFTGSSGNRKTNITVGSSKYNGLILKPGEEFSFNKYLGDVDAKNGFKPEIVIKREGLVPEFGGGLCQVSSTAFRAAMNAGFPITARKNHAFAVRYYSPAGTDATIYSPTVDLKFVNDLSSHMLVRTRMEGTKLYYEYYGTKDDRQVVLEGPVHYDKKADGSLKAVWTKKVTKNGETVQQDFRSNYVSPNLYQKVATTQASTPNPVATPTPANPTQEAPTPAPLPAPTPTPST